MKENFAKKYKNNNFILQLPAARQYAVTSTENKFEKLKSGGKVVVAAISIAGGVDVVVFVAVFLFS